MAAGGGEGVVFFNRGLADGGIGDTVNGDRQGSHSDGTGMDGANDSGPSRAGQTLRNLRIDTQVSNRRPGTAMSTGGASASEDELNSATSDIVSGVEGQEIWHGELSSVVGLQKRGLRGLMEGRRIREQYREGSGDGRVGLGIA